MSLHVLFVTELFPADLALERLESTVYSVDVGLEGISSSKILPTFTALVEFEFLLNPSDVSVKMPFLGKCLATGLACAVIDICVDCALVSHQV